MIAARTLYRAWRLCRNSGIDLFRIDTGEPLTAIPGWDALGLSHDSQAATNILEMLRAIELRHRDVAAEASKVRLVATLPPSLRVVATTRDVAEALIRGAKKEILVVGYRVSEPGFMRLLQASGMAGLQVTVVSDRGEDDAKMLFESWPARAAALRAYRGVEPAQGQTLIHAKAIVVDRVRALVGSANFSVGGFRNNVELGVEVEGAVPAEIIHLVDRLIEGRWLETVGGGQRR